jgi:hypothetical protein
LRKHNSFGFLTKVVLYFDPRSSRLPIKREVLAKSITAINLSAGLALEGYKVLLIDTDAQANSTRVLILDAETGMITDVNPFLIKLLGYSREEFLEKKTLGSGRIQRY